MTVRSSRSVPIVACALAVSALAVSALTVACSPSHDPVKVGALYPLTGPQSPGGRAEFRGVQVATALTNRNGGVAGHTIQLVPVDVPDSDAAPEAVDGLRDRGVRFVLGSHASTISSPASDQAVRDGMLFWETGAVGEMMRSGRGRLAFRVSPSGAGLGASAIAYIDQHVAPAMHRDPRSLRWAVANVDDLYGSWVAAGAVDEIRRLGLPFAGQVRYDLAGLDAAATVRHIKALRPDVLFVSAYVNDGVALRRQMVVQHLRLVANIGSSSSYCMPQFGKALGDDAVGLFASDKPDADSISPRGLTAAGRALLHRAVAAYRARFGREMDAPALAGFSAAWALFHDVMPKASDLTPVAVAAAANRVHLPTGSLPNGSGLSFGAVGSSTAGSNVLAASVIWEWTREYWRGVVWPPRFATERMRVIPIAA